MAVPVGGRWRVTTASGAVVSGGKVRFYDAGTTNLSTLYTSSALSTPLTNPVVAGSDGWTPQVFAAEGLTCDVDFLTAGDVVISGQSLEDAIFVGQANTTFSRDFTNSRVQIRGSAGTVYFEAGDPTGDDVGGNGRLGGWDGSQAVTWTVDAATTNVTGLLTAASKSIGGIVTTSATSFSAAASVNIPLSVPLTGIAAWDVFVYDLKHATDATALKATLSFDGASSFKTGVSDYSTSVLASYATSVAHTTDAAEAYIHLTDTATVKQNAAGQLKLGIIGPSATANFTNVTSEYVTAYSVDSTLATWRGSHSSTGSAFGTPTHVQLFASTGNISGKYVVVGRFGFI